MAVGVAVVAFRRGSVGGVVVVVWESGVHWSLVRLEVSSWVVGLSVVVVVVIVGPIVVGVPIRRW